MYTSYTQNSATDHARKNTRQTMLDSVWRKTVDSSTSSKLMVAIAKWIATTCRQIYIVEDEGLRNIIRIASNDPTYELPLRPQSSLGYTSCMKWRGQNWLRSWNSQRRLHLLVTTGHHKGITATSGLQPIIKSRHCIHMLWPSWKQRTDTMLRLVQNILWMQLRKREWINSLIIEVFSFIFSFSNYLNLFSTFIWSTFCPAFIISSHCT